jgi:hypothetical protein
MAKNITVKGGSENESFHLLLQYIIRKSKGSSCTVLQYTTLISHLKNKEMSDSLPTSGHVLTICKLFYELPEMGTSEQSSDYR